MLRFRREKLSFFTQCFTFLPETVPGHDAPSECGPIYYEAISRSWAGKGDVAATTLVCLRACPRSRAPYLANRNVAAVSDQTGRKPLGFLLPRRHTHSLMAFFRDGTACDAEDVEAGERKTCATKTEAGSVKRASSACRPFPMSIIICRSCCLACLCDPHVQDTGNVATTPSYQSPFLANVSRQLVTARHFSACVSQRSCLCSGRVSAPTDAHLFCEVLLFSHHQSCKGLWQGSALFRSMQKLDGLLCLHYTCFPSL